MFGSYDKAIEVVTKEYDMFLEKNDLIEKPEACYGAGIIARIINKLQEAKTNEITEYEQHCEGAGKVPETDNDYDVLKDGDPY